MPVTDWILTVVFLCLILLLLFFLDKLSKIHRLSALFSRKSLHLLVGLFIVVSAYILETVFPILILSFVFLIFDWWAIRSNRFQNIHVNKKSYGTVFFPLAVFILSLLLWDSYKLILIISILIMAVADVAAAVAGERYAKRTWILLREKKSLPGSMVMLIVSFFILLGMLSLNTNLELYKILLISSIVAIQATAAESISANGSDNLSVPVIVSLFLYLFLNPSLEIEFMQIILGTVFSLILGFFSYKYNFLQLSGVISLILMGGIIYGIGGLQYTIPIVLFFLSSSIFSFVKKGFRQQFTEIFEKSGTRDVTQVFANGGVATILAVISIIVESPLIYPLYLASVAAAAADTWSTEIGVLSIHKPRLITTLKSAEKGTSGAISVTGTFAGLTGSILIVLCGFFLAGHGHQMYSNYYVVAALCGFLSGLIDSILGATVQVQYICKKCLKLTERKIHCETPTKYMRGIHFIQNDMVNFASIVLSTMVCFIVVKFII